MTDFFQIVTYPADKKFKINGQVSQTIFTNFLGGVERNDEFNKFNARVTGFKAMQWQYLLANTYDSVLLEEELTFEMRRINDKYDNLNVYWETYMQTETEFNTKLFFEELPKVALTFFFVILWCCVGALHSDARNSKPWHGLVGICCTGFAILAGFGARFWFQEDTFQTFLVAIPLMALAIGLDDMFILMNSWHNTDISLPREERAKMALMEGGTSIFVTVTMTIIDFVVGTETPYPAIQTYSTFALWVLAYDFFLQITIFVAVLVMSDGCEKAKLQSCCCCFKTSRRTVKSKAIRKLFANSIIQFKLFFFSFYFLFRSVKRQRLLGALLQLRSGW